MNFNFIEYKKMRFKEFLIEKITPADKKFIQNIIDIISKKSDFVGMYTRETIAKNTNEKNIEIRIKPKDVKKENEYSINDIEKLIKNNQKKLEIDKIKFNPISPNSGRFSSIGFVKDNKLYDLVIAKGANRGEVYENELVLKLQKFLSGSKLDIDEYDEIMDLLTKISKLDPSFKISEIIKIEKRSGSTIRKDIPPHKLGEVIGDIIITTKIKKYYLSIKDKRGDKIANIGLRGLFNDDFSINKNVDSYEIFKELDLDENLIKDGFLAYKNNSNKKRHFLTYKNNSNKKQHIVQLNKPIKQKSILFKTLMNGWGFNYFYVREYKNTFKVIKVDEDYVKNVLLKNLLIKEIQYPYRDSKQISIYIDSDYINYKIEIRNTKGEIKPTELKIKIIKSNL